MKLDQRGLPVWPAQPIRVLLVAGVVPVVELNLLRGLDQNGKRVFFGFGPADEVFPVACTPAVFDTVTGRMLEQHEDVSVKMQLYVDQAGIARFLAPRALMVTNN